MIVNNLTQYHATSLCTKSLVLVHVVISYDVPVGFVNCNPPPILRLCIALFAVAEGWLLLDIGWFVLFLSKLTITLNAKDICTLLQSEIFHDVLAGMQNKKTTIWICYDNILSRQRHNSIINIDNDVLQNTNVPDYIAYSTNIINIEAKYTDIVKVSCNIIV